MKKWAGRFRVGPKCTKSHYTEQGTCVKYIRK